VDVDPAYLEVAGFVAVAAVEVAVVAGRLEEECLAEEHLAEGFPEEEYLVVDAVAGEVGYQIC